jgi:acetyl-CoA carboxylase carboxyltransferase component
LGLPASPTLKKKEKNEKKKKKKRKRKRKKKHEYKTLYRKPIACADVSFLPLLVTPLGRRAYLSTNLIKGRSI